MDNNNLNMPNIPNNNVNSQPPQQPTGGVVPATSVAPPSVGNNNLSFDEEDGKILKPFVEQPVEPVSEVPQNPVLSEPEALPNGQPDVIVDNNGNLEDAGIMENKKMEKVEIEYTPPGKFKTFFMFFMFAVILGTIIFMPQITAFIEKLKETPTPTVNDEEVLSGTLTCGLETNDDKFDLIYSGEFTFTNRELKSLNYTITTKGDRVQDSTALDEAYNNCKSLSAELNTKSVGVKVVCDLYDGTLRVDQIIDYSSFASNDAATLFKKYSIDLADFEANQNIGDIERQLKSSNYICTMEAKSE